MLLTLATLREIEAGHVDLVFRLWRKPTVKQGGRLRTHIGELAIGDVSVVEPATIDDAQAKRAGYASADDLRSELLGEHRGSTRSRTARPDATSRVYRVEVSLAGPDPRVALRERLLDAGELPTMLAKLDAMDARSSRGPWTQETLELIEAWPARRAPELAELARTETLPWKANVRRLKELGLTESLQVGYRLSPRGEQVVRARRRPAK